MTHIRQMRLLNGFYVDASEEPKMHVKVIWGAVCVFLCVLSGIAGAYSATVLQERLAEAKALQVRRLELTDRKKHVRAVLAVEDDGSVSLRMLSKENVAVVELGVNEDRGRAQNRYTPSGGLTIRDGEGIPVIRLRTFNKGDGALSFSSVRTEDQVAVGYIPYGDVIDEHDRAIWGVAVRGANHESTGVGVHTVDGIAQEFVGPRKTNPGQKELSSPRHR